MRIRTVPFPQASIVEYDGRQYLINGISTYNRIDYAILGHRKLGTEGRGLAWVDHSDLKFVSKPTVQSWNWLDSLHK